MARRRRSAGLTVDCGSEDFVEAVHGYMEEHCYEVDDDATQAAGEAGQRAARLLQERSRQRPGGRYARGWVADMEASETGVEVVIHNKRMPQLTHLLEKGHAIANQFGRYDGTVRGDGIIAQVAEEVGGEFEGRFQS